MRTAGKRNLVMLCTIALVMLFMTGLYARFLLDDTQVIDTRPVQNDQNNQNTQNQQPARASFSPNIATSIRVSPLAGADRSVKITWELSDGSNDTFIVGRTTALPSTPEEALKAISIKTVLPGAPKVCVDRNIPAGTYYYVIIAKSAAARREVELYPNENYTTNPIVVKDTGEMQGGTADQISGIKVEKLQGREVQVSWTPVQGTGINYTIYRSSEPLASPAIIARAEKVSVVRDQTSFIDRSVLPGQEYFYAVTTSMQAGVEDRNLIPGQSYSIEPVRVESDQPAEKRVTLLKAFAQGAAIDVNWRPIPMFNGTYLVYRASSPINDRVSLTRASLLGKVQGDRATYTDVSAANGVWYYAVLAETDDGTIFRELVAGDNTLERPVQAGSTAGPVVPDNGHGTNDNTYVESTAVDVILRETYFRGNYREAIRRLGNIAETSTNVQDVAKSRLFIGRSYVGLHQYRTALNYFIREDVMRIYRREAEFWRDYCLERLR